MGGLSLFDTQHQLIIDTVRNTARGEWKVLVVDEASRKLLDNVVKEDDILNLNITNIEEIDQRRPMNKDMDVVYILTPLPHIVDCLMADFERRRYRRSYLYWTSILPPPLRERIDRSNNAREQIAMFKVLNLDYFPRESHIVTFRDPWSFPILYHPACSNLVPKHIADLSQKVVAVCVSLGEDPDVRFYRPRAPNPTHEAHVLCGLIARAVQEELDVYKRFHPDFPPPSPRPRSALYITDRSMDLVAPFIHEFTYQAMAHDLLPIQEGTKITYTTTLNEGRPDAETKEMEINEKDQIWVENRHLHMKDTIEKLMGDFQRFIADNPHFTNADSNTTSLNAIKDMLAGLPEFQSLKEAYSLHLSMAQDCMNIFQQHKLPDLASLEQSLATGLDEDYRKPKNLADQVVRMLDEDSIPASDRLRLITLYLLYKDGLLPSDIRLLSSHAKLPPQDEEVLRNLELLGARVYKSLKDAKPPPPPLFPRKPPPTNNAEEYGLSRFETNIKQMLEAHVSGTIDNITFPQTKPDPSQQSIDPNSNISSASLRSAKPTWAKSKLSSIEPRQRILVFVAGGATYSESRACYEVSRQTSRDVVLVTSHMLNPGLFMRQVGDLSVERRRLGIPADAPPKKAPSFLFEEDKPKPVPVSKSPQPPVKGRTPAPGAGVASGAGGAPMKLPQLPAPPPGVPTKQMGAMNLNGGGRAPGQPIQLGDPAVGSKKLTKEGKEGKEKKKHHFFGSSKKEK
ncbi:Sec1-like protein [Tothia fuscella]|uniref:Sec1-like protein n=1 Tax=Tothia fuscella TaxID=1048955 RepID=A0A9P4NP66_9PEZI|nr:Sec1-like protein [Tothia fuscella]